jgi:hypothetical protein
MDPQIIGYFMFFILILLNIFLRFISHKKFSTSSSYNRYTRQFTTWNAYITSFLLIFCSKTRHDTIKVAFIIYGILTNWFVLTARWYWFKLPNHTFPLSWILSDLWFHLIVPIVYTFFAMYMIQQSNINKRLSEYVMALAIFLCTLTIWYTLNIGTFLYSSTMFPWPYNNSAGTNLKNNPGQQFKFALTFLNIVIVLFYGFWFWNSIPRTFFYAAA